MSAGVLITLVIGATVLLVLSFLFAGMPFAWYVAGAVCLYKGLTVPGVACVAVGLLIHGFRHWRKARR
jgi:hypothetical protein